MNRLWQFHVFHGCIGGIDLALELGRLFVQVRDDQGHVTKDVGVDDGADRDEGCDESYLESASRQDVVAREQQHGVVQRDEVLVRERAVVEVGFHSS